MSYKVYRIGDAAKLLQVKTSVLRFWEEAFSQIRPKRTDKGQRYYSEKDMETLIRIRALLYDEGMTISGAQKALRKPQATKEFFKLEEISIVINSEIISQASSEINPEINTSDSKSIQQSTPHTPMHSTIQIPEQISGQSLWQIHEQVLAQDKIEIEKKLETRDLYKQNIFEIQEELKNIQKLLSYNS